MSDDALEWDDAKAAEIWRRHGVSFQQDAKALRDPFAVEWIDDRENYGEERINVLGNVRWRVSPTPSVANGHGSSRAKRATRREQDHYYRENAP
ncbi:MAG: BrnT family toxin [Stellaceae bacterium]